MSAPPKLCEVFQIAHHNPRSLREYQVFRIFEHGGHPQPWKKALIIQRVINIKTDELIPNRMLTTPVIIKPNPIK